MKRTVKNKMCNVIVHILFSIVSLVRFHRKEENYPQKSLLKNNSMSYGLSISIKFLYVGPFSDLSSIIRGSAEQGELRSETGSVSASSAATEMLRLALQFFGCTSCARV